MSKRKIFIFITVIIFTLFLTIFTNNNSNSLEISFSKPSGFYNESFYLEINSNVNGRIYYTLDGSNPDENSIKYEGPILIEDATKHENIYSSRTDTSIGYDNEFIDKYCDDNPQYEVPNYNVDKCTIIKAIVYDSNHAKSEIKTNTYFVDYSNKKEYEGINIMCITTDPYNLFDYNNGIYVTGVNSDLDKQSIIGNEMEDYDWMFVDANYKETHTTRKPAVCQVFVDNKLVLDQECDINIHGGGSRAFAQKSLNIYAKDKKEVEPKFKYNFFENDYYPSSVTLSNAGDDYKVKLKDYLFNSLTKDKDFVTMHFEPYVLFINGEFWGFYWLTEKYDESFFEHYYGISDNNVVVIKEYDVSVGKHYDISLFNQLKKLYENTNLSDPEMYEKFKEQVDVDSFIDYFSTLIYVSRAGDWPIDGGNLALWRSRKISNKPYEDGKWRWIVFDVNSYSMSYDLIEHDSIEPLLEDDEYANIFCNEELMSMLLNRLEQLKNTNFTVDNIDKVIDDAIKDIGLIQNSSNRRFFGDKSSSYFIQGADEIKNFFKQRPEYIDKLIEKYK